MPEETILVVDDEIANLHPELHQFIGGAELSEDITIIALRRRS